MLTIVGICAVFCLLTLQVQNVSSAANVSSVTAHVSSVTAPLASPTVMLEVGHNCSSSSPCAHPLMCDDDNLCRISIHNDCSGTDATCANGLKCDQNRTCKGDIGYNCSKTPTNDTCATDLLCNGIHCNEALHINSSCDILDNSDAQGHECPTNTICSNPGTCTCDTIMHYFDIDIITGNIACEKRKTPGQSCSFAYAENPCVTGAKCDGHHCQCVTENLYVINENNNGCYKLLTHGQGACNSSRHCVPNADCPNNTTCQCLPTHFPSYDGLCEPRKPGDGSICNSTNECVGNATCTTDLACFCNEAYYNDGSSCEARLKWDQVCGANIKNQCLFFGECVDGRCKCSHGNFKMLNGSCSPPIIYRRTCELFNHEPQQCGNGTHCVFRPHDNGPLCACDLNHYFDGQGCLPRIRVGHPCAHVGVYSGENQCVQNAICDSNSHICVCNTNYFARQGLCPPKVPLGDICDPWDNSEYQCESGTCIHGRCL